MHQFLIDLLRGIEAAVSPPEHCHHAITFAQDRLALRVNDSGTWHCLFLDQADFAKPAPVLVAEIMAMLDGARHIETNP